MADTSVLNLRIDSKQALAALKTFNSKLNRLGKDISLKVSAPLAALEGVAVKTFANMEKGLTDITNLLDKDAGFAQYEEQLEGVQEMAIEMGFAIDDVNKSLFDNVSALGMGEVALEAYAEAQRLAIAGNAELSKTVDGISSVVNAYGQDMTDSKDVANAFFLAQKAGKTNISELASTIGKVAPIARTAGVGFEELLATMSVLTKGGLSTAEATTSLKGAINAIINPSKEAFDELEKLGIANSITDLKADGLTETFYKLNEAYKKDNNIITKLIPNQEALVAVTGLNEELLSLSVKTQKEMNKQRGTGQAVNEAYEESLDDIDFIMLKVAGVTKTLSGAIGELLVDGLDLKELFKDMAEGAKDLKEFIQGMTPEMKKTAAVVAGIATTGPPAAVAITSMATAIGFMSKSLIGLKVVLPTLIAAAAPIAAIAGVAAAGIAVGSIAYDIVHAEEKEEKAFFQKNKAAYLKQTQVEQEKLNKLKRESAEIDEQIKGIIEEKEADAIKELIRLDEERFQKQMEQDEKRAARLEGTYGADIFKRIEKEKGQEIYGYGAELGLTGLESPEETIKRLKVEATLALDKKEEKDRASESQITQKAVEGAFLKGTLEAQKLEKTQFTGKIQNKQLKEAKKANSYLNTIASNQTTTEVADF